MKQVTGLPTRIAKKQILFVVLSFLFLLVCSKTTLDEPEEHILVQIGEKNISVDEFIRRSEYTVRPPYCRGNHNLDKKIIINSLIAEKLMSIEAHDTNDFILHDNIQAYLRGRKEQLMRQWLYEKEARHKVVLDTTQIKKIFQVAGRRYNISYFNIPDGDLVSLMATKIKTSDKSFEDVYFEATHLDTLPQREVDWSAHEHDLILDSLFAKPMLKNQIVGPLQIADDQHMLIKINGWIDRPAVSHSQIQERWKKITDEYKEREAVRLFDQFILNVMRGKTIEFYPDVFFQVADLLGPIYIQTTAEKEKLMQDTFWQKDNDAEKYANVQDKIKVFYQEPFFKVDGKTWTVQDFVDELAAHPLVFRQKKMKKNEFGQQLQFAIMDMIRDKVLNEIAYKRGYDKINVIERRVNMWRDNLNYQSYKSQYLKSVLPDSLTEMPYMQVIEDYLNQLVDSLQTKYSEIIQVDVDTFNDIQLTRIDMSVTRQNVPFTKIVPSFPLVTTDNALDYGKKMEMP
ncbi:hypothetical protein EH223_18845 [candidate division KSB1 bacterium]|nr:hypothetical protein [candidate division KSB1 bacterium]RQW00361.1 MAG: hypothetical protein EH223_18845 [candidate division KSB1 bacterium]